MNAREKGNDQDHVERCDYRDGLYHVADGPYQDRFESGLWNHMDDHALRDLGLTRFAINIGLL